MSVRGAAPAAEAAWQRDLLLIAMPALAAFAVCVVNRGAFMDGDTNWHLATGRWILLHHQVPTHDPFSYTAFGKRWVTHEWLSQALMAAAWMAGGWSAVMVLIGAAAAATTALLAAELRARLGAVATLACLAVSFSVLFLHLLARPFMIALPMMAVWTIALVRARRADRIPPLWLLPLATLWANLQGTVIFGLAFLGPFALEAVLAVRSKAMAAMPPAADDGAQRPFAGLRATARREVRALTSGGVGPVAVKWAGFIVAAGLMALITPNGLDALTYPFYLVSSTAIRSIAEWHSISFDQVGAFQVAFFIALYVCLSRGVRIGAVRLGLLLLLLFMTLQHRREEVFLAVVAPLLLAEPLGLALDPTRARERPAPWPPLRQVAAPAAVTAALFLALCVWRLAIPVTPTDRRTVPLTALAHVPASLRARPVFNEYSFGGWLVFNGVRPFMDGRSDMYGDALSKLYFDAAKGDPATIERVFRRYDIQWTIMPPSSALVARLDARPGWRRLYADKWAVVQVRDDAVPPTRPG